ncbi:nucleotidyltransferase family protein [Dyadobacter fermentans]|uniref:DNA polymerase beta domain protein region n=1 Tax=Dyadobacter fermentans (strain ATCC 700827 / DSM 18053 / CIP 107007 / KCTC 52180 / NS114) TaxID=471854 RepID=C6VV58_DYAFD|nr:nucleotidyltransferase family protein [Dyadobacter fermentans]ACT94881.1 DNA polymerase beta domain protein region [Dyadobacter fermentans DSM 18053]
MDLPEHVLRGIETGRKEIASGRFMTLDEFRKRISGIDEQPTRVLDALRKSKESLFSRYPLNSMALFGSYARNEARFDSDVDIIVEFSEPVGFEFVDLMIELEEILGRKVDLVSRRGVRPELLPIIERDEIYI